MYIFFKNVCQTFPDTTIRLKYFKAYNFMLLEANRILQIFSGANIVEY